MKKHLRNAKFRASCGIALIAVWLAFPPVIHADLVAYWPLDGDLKDVAPSGQTKDDGKFVGKATFKDGKIGKGICTGWLQPRLDPDEPGP